MSDLKRIPKAATKAWKQRREWVRLLTHVDSVSVVRYFGSMARHLPDIVRTGSTAPLNRALAGRRCTFKVLGHSIEVDGEFFGGARELYCRQVYFAEPGFKLRPNDVVVDLGANVGLFSTLASKCAARVVAVEAQSGFIDLIHDNLRRNDCEHKATVVHAMVGSETGILASSEGRATASHYELEPEVISMPTLFERCDISSVDFLKIDIEGSEYSLLQEDTDWLRKVRRIAMEVHGEHGSPSEIVTTLQELGFTVSCRDEGLQLLPELGGGDGYLFAHRER